MFPNRNRQAVDVTGNKTLAAADQGRVQAVTDAATADVVLTLPATAACLFFIIRNETGIEGKERKVSISPAAADLIIGLDATGVDNKDLYANAVDIKPGDEIALIGNGTTGYHVAWVVGDDWKFEA